MRSFVLVVLGLVALWSVLGVLQVVPLPFGLLERTDSANPGGDLLEGTDAQGSAGARLQGLGERKQPVVAAAPVEPPVPAEVRGSVPRGATLRGRVVAGGEVPTPIAGARVRLLRPNAITTFLKTEPEGRWDVLEARSGADGRFAFLDVRPNSGYVVRARVGDRTASTRNVDVVERQVLDVGDLLVGPEASLSGRVVDGAGAPLAEVRVAVAWRVQSIFDMVLPDPDLLPETEAHTTTDAEGKFRLAPLENGTKTLVVASPNHGSTVRSDVAVVDDTVLTADIRLGATGVLGGRVEWEDGKPAAGARVFAVDEIGPNGTLFFTTAGPDGAFRFEHIEGDPLRLGVYVQGVMGQPSAPVKLGTLDAVFKVSSVGAVQGRVVRKADRQPVARFGVRLEPQDKEPWMTKALRIAMDQVVGPMGFTSPDGTFRIPVTARGSYVAVVTAAGFPEGRSERFEVPVAGTGDTGTIALADGNVLAGTVRTVAGDALPRARLRIVADKGQDEDEGDSGWWYGNEAPLDGVTDEEGRFTLPPQTPGKYLLIVEHRFGQHHVERGIDLKSGSRADLDLRLDPAGAVRVRVVDPVGKPVPNASLILVRADGGDWWASSNAEGVAEFESVPPGGCVVRWGEARPASLVSAVTEADDDGGRSRAYEALRTEAGEHVVRTGTETSVTVKIPRRTRVLVKVEPWSNEVETVEHVAFFVRDAGASGWRGQWFQTSSTGDGRFEALLEPGRYSVFALPKPGGWTRHKAFENVEVPEAAVHPLDLGR